MREPEPAPLLAVSVVPRTLVANPLPPQRVSAPIHRHGVKLWLRWAPIAPRTPKRPEVCGMPDEIPGEHERPRPVGGTAEPAEPSAEDLLVRVAKGDERAFELLYDRLAAPVFGLVRRVVRDGAQSEEVAQEVLVELWRTATRYAPDRGSALNWALTLAHRRAVDRVRSARASTERERKATFEASRSRPFDEVSEAVTSRLERQQVRRCLSHLTDLQRESVLLAYYQGYTYREVAEVLDTPQGTVKTRLRDGLIRLRDCLGVAA
jgi:RNA polymerase sigma-70 factor (ECF subfamily)